MNSVCESAVKTGIIHLLDLDGAIRKEKKPIKPKMTDVFEGCKCHKKKMTVKKGKKVVKVKKKKKKKQ